MAASGQAAGTFLRALAIAGSAVRAARGNFTCERFRENLSKTIEPRGREKWPTPYDIVVATSLVLNLVIISVREISNEAIVGAARLLGYV